jgi:hypothetical protein
VAALTEKEIDDREDRVQPSAKLGRSRRVKIHVRLCVQKRLMCSAGVSPAGVRAEAP